MFASLLHGELEKAQKTCSQAFYSSSFSYTCYSAEFFCLKHSYNFLLPYHSFFSIIPIHREVSNRKLSSAFSTLQLAH